MIQLPNGPNEGSSFEIPIEFRNKAEELTAPAEASFMVSDVDGVEIQELTPISAPSATVEINVSAENNIIGQFGKARIVYVEWLYNIGTPNEEKGTEEIYYDIKPLKNVKES